MREDMITERCRKNEHRAMILKDAARRSAALLRRWEAYQEERESYARQGYRPQARPTTVSLTRVRSQSSTTSTATCSVRWDALTTHPSMTAVWSRQGYSWNGCPTPETPTKSDRPGAARLRPCRRPGRQKAPNAEQPRT